MSNANDYDWNTDLIAELSTMGPIVAECVKRMEARGAELINARMQDWEKVGERRWGTAYGEASKKAVRAGNDRPYLFKHDQYARVGALHFMVETDEGDVSFLVIIPQTRYGKNGKVRQQRCELGGLYYDRADLAYMVNESCPEWAAAKKALGL